MLLNNKSDPNFKDMMNNTPYHFVIVMNCPGLIPEFEKYGADGFIKNVENLSVVDMGIKTKDTEMIGRLAGVEKYKNMFK